MMSHLDDDRIARLQRAAYGADVPDEDRAAASTELAALRSSREQGPARRRSGDGHGSGAADPHARADRAATATASEDPPEVPPDDAPQDGAGAMGTRDRARTASARIRLGTATAIAIALLAGLAAGWTLDAVVSRAGEARTVLASETEAWRVFDLPALNGHPARYPEPRVDLDLDRDSRRVLAARWDGVRLVAVRSVDGRDACLVLIVPLGPPAAACTVDGRFPVEGLVAEAERQGAGFYSATWDATGRISLDPAAPAD